MTTGLEEADVHLRSVAAALLAIAVVRRGDADRSLRDEVLVLVGGLALAAVTGALAVTTERRRRAMREVERYFTLSPEMVILAVFHGYWKRVNPAVESVLGYTEQEALARPFMEFVHPDDRERTEEEARRVVGGATALAFENRIACKDGSYRLIEWTVRPVPEEHVMYGVGRDITERRRSQSQQAAFGASRRGGARSSRIGEVCGAIAEEIGAPPRQEEVRMFRFDSDSCAVVVAGSGGRDPSRSGRACTWKANPSPSRVLRTGRTATDR